MLPWFVKIPAKIALSRTPISRSLLNRIGVFRHGEMIRPSYALGVVRKHVAAAEVELTGKTVLELGPGDSVGNGIVAFALGAERSILVDMGSWASRSLQDYQRFVDHLVEALPDNARMQAVSREWRSFEHMLESFGISYEVRGVDSLRAIPAGSIDFCFSHAVLEHVRVAEFSPTMRELRRVMRGDGVMSHVVDFQDHLQAGLNNMRFSKQVWESPLFANSGFYTNRLRHSDVMRELKTASFQITSERLQRWERLPTPLPSLHSEFRHYSQDELLICGAHVVAKPAH